MNLPRPHASDSSRLRASLAERPIRVLVVDDNQVVLEATQQTLTTAGLHVATVSNPMLVPSRMRKFRPDLILLDLNMPTVSGVEVAQALSRSDLLANTVLVLFSGESDESQLQRVARECGARGWIRKSRRGQALVDEILRLLEHARTLSGEFSVSKQAALFVSPPLQELLRKLLAKSGVEAVPRGPFWIQRALRDDPVDLIVIEASVLGASAEFIVTMLREEGLLEGVAVIVLDETPSDEVWLYPDHLDEESLRRAVEDAFARIR